ncbi:MAG: TetR/AcrR family transcriptional regulator [Actinomycetota bacterium]
MATPGRPRNPDIDQAVLATTVQHLAEHGYEALSLVGIAEQAGTTRQAIYRRWAGKADLATAAIASLSTAADRPDTDRPFDDLVTELRAFQRGVTRPNGVSMVGSMLQSGTDPELVERFRERIVEPRRTRIGHILDRAAEAGEFAADADLATAAAAATGTLYAMVLAGVKVSKTWPQDTARFLWRGLGGMS